MKVRARPAAGDQTEWRAHLVEAHRLFTETGATGHAARLAKVVGSL